MSERQEKVGKEVSVKEQPTLTAVEITRILPGFAVLFFFLLLGEFLSHTLHLPISGSVAGMVLLALGLGLKVIPLSWVEDASRILLHYLSLFFVPAGVGLIAYAELLRESWLPIAVSITLGTVVTLLATALIYQISKLVRSRRTTE